MEFVYIGLAGRCSPFQPVRKVDMKNESFYTDPGQAFNRGSIVDVEDKKKIQMLEDHPDFVTLEGLEDLAKELNLDTEAYDWDDLAKAYIWLSRTVPEIKRRMKMGSPEGIQDKDAPVEILRLESEDDSPGQDEEDTADSPVVDSEPGLDTSKDPDKIDEGVLEDDQPDGKDETEDEEEAKPADNPPDENEYYCSKCNGNHRKTSQVGKDHSKHAAPVPE